MPTISDADFGHVVSPCEAFGSGKHDQSIVQEEASQHNTRLQAVTSSRLEAEAQVEALQEELAELEPEFQQQLAAMPPDQKSAYLGAQDEACSHSDQCGCFGFHQFGVCLVS